VRRRLARPELESDRFAVLPPDAWRAQLPETHILVLALPLTQETRGIVGHAELSALPDGAFVVNVGRARTLDEDALFAALACGRVAGAALDVLDEEPPARESRAWSEAGLLLTPHVARSPEKPPFRWEPLFVENLRRFVAGEPLLNVVDIRAGY
jgi:phosphoglycerate dehydrogenase-like enzyme